MQWVLDASLAISWCFEDEQTPRTEALLERATQIPSCVPQHWALEVTNVLVLAVRRGRLLEAKRAKFLSVLQSLPIRIDSQSSAQLISSVIPLADAYSLTTYDAAYLELCMRIGVPLATLDRELISAATRAGIPTL